MRINKYRAKGFQSFEDSGTLCFQQGINIIVGQNNSGKSALLRGFLAPLKDDRHRNKSKYEKHHLDAPSTMLEVEVTGDELKEAFLRRSTPLVIPVPNLPSIQVNNIEQARPHAEQIFRAQKLYLQVTNTPANEFQTQDYPSHRLFDQLSTTQRIGATLIPNAGNYDFGGLVLNGSDQIPSLIYWLYQQNIFFFDSERYSIGACQHSHATRLTSNASNLPSVLDTLAGERGDLFKRLILHMREIFSSFGNLSIRPSLDNSAFNEVLIWPTEEMLHPDLGFSLDNSGTGVAQILALLTAAMTLDKCVIVVDEISSFLHPAATKSLLRIVNEHYGQHQYIISTHAPEVISFAGNEAVFLVKKEGYKSSVATIDLSTKDNFVDVAALLGISMTDVFASDQIIWVEGPTEEICFPYIYKETTNTLPHGLLFSSATPGDFNAKRRDKEMIFEIYRKLSQASASLTVSLAFSFDSEKLTSAEKQKMLADSRGLIHFLPRRHFECYLISPSAIAAFINRQDKEPNGVISANDVETELQNLAATQRFDEGHWKNSLLDSEWLGSIDAAKMINACCENLTSARVTFGKTVHSLLLLEYILENEVETIEELVAYVKSLVEK